MSSRDNRRGDRSWEREDRDRPYRSERGSRVFRDEGRRRNSRSRSPRRSERDRRWDSDRRDYGRDRDSDRRDRDRDRRDDRKERDRNRDRERERKNTPNRTIEGDTSSRSDRSKQPDHGSSRKELDSAPGGAVSEANPPFTSKLENDTEDGEAMDAVNDDDTALMVTMGLSGFGSTKGKHVEGNQEGSVNLKKIRTWRQYMNRRGGFNRPLDKIK